MPRPQLVLFLSGLLPLIASSFAPPATPAIFAQSRRGTFVEAPRSVRSRTVDQQHLKLEIRVDLERQEAHATAHWTFSPFQPIRSLTLDAAEMQIKQVSVVVSPPQPGSRALGYRRSGGSLEIDLDREYAVGEPFTLAIEYSLIHPRHGLHFVVPDPSEPNQPRMAWTQSEPEYARYWIPCLDTPADRMTSEIIATVPAKFITLSNGELVRKEARDGGDQTWHWQQKQSHVPYLISLVVGDFEELKQDWNGLPVLSYVARGRLADAPRSFGQTPEMLTLFSKHIGLKYPWPKYAQICVDEYMWGGMEHTSATTLTDRTLHDERAALDVSSEGLVAHELAHQWFGDLMTCKDWGELWLNESFATYFASLWLEHDEGWDEATWSRYREGLEYQEEDRRYRRPIVTYQYRDPGSMFDGHSYPKGARVLHMLRFVLGDAAFFRAIQQYAAANQHRTVETADLRRAIEDATGQGLNWFFDEWIHRGGHPEFDVAWSWDEATRSVRLNVKQTQKVDDLTPLFRLPVEIEFAHRDQVQIRRIEVSRAEQTFDFQLDRRPTRVCFDPREWLLKTLRFPKSKEELLDQLAQDQHILPRVQAAAALAEFVEEQDTQAALRWTSRKDSFWGVRQEAVKMLAKLNRDEVQATLLEVAQQDPHAKVRREAIAALGNFSHDAVRETLRRVLSADRSYYVVAEAVRSLHKVDRDRCAADLLTACRQDSHEQVVLRAAADGLVDLKHLPAGKTWTELLEKGNSPERRAVLIGALARLQPQDPGALERLHLELANERVQVRRVAVDALVALGDSTSLRVLLDQRAKEESPRMVRTLDTAIERLRAKELTAEQQRRDLRELREKNQQLEQRLESLEKKTTEK